MKKQSGLKPISRREFITAMGTAIGGVVFASCAPASATTTAPTMTPVKVATPTVASAKASVVTVVHPSIVQTLDPNIGVVEVVRSVTGHFYDQILELTADAKIKPMLAESYRAIDPLTWEFKLRKGVKFHDGTPFNAEVMKFTINRILDAKYNSLQKTYWVAVDSVETPDEYTCVIKTKTPMGTMPYTMALTTPVPPSVGMDPAGFPAKPIGTGPFKFVEWVKDDKIVMEAFDGYWGGPPKVKQVIFRTIPELSTRMSALEAGEVDIVLEVIPEDAKRLTGNSNLDILTVETFRTSWLWMNGQRKPFTDVRVRQAIQYAINMEEIAKTIIAGVGFKARAPISPKVFGFNPNLPPYKYDPVKAKALLADAGFPNGFETTVKGMGERGGYTRFGDVAEVIVAQLGEVGIKATPIAEDPASANKNLLELNWDLTFAGSTSQTGDADNGMGRLYLSSAKRTGWSNEQVDKLLMIGRESTDQDVRLKAYLDAQEILWREGPTYWTYHHYDTIGVNKRIKGFVGRPDRQLRVRDVSL